jgi:hypothetical protein
MRQHFFTKLIWVGDVIFSDFTLNRKFKLPCHNTSVYCFYFFQQTLFVTNYCTSVSSKICWRCKCSWGWRKLFRRGDPHYLKKKHTHTATQLDIRTTPIAPRTRGDLGQRKATVVSRLCHRLVLSSTITRAKLTSPSKKLQPMRRGVNALVVARLKRSENDRVFNT